MEPSTTRFALVGAGLIAVAYGLARFAFGLFVPPIRDALGLTPSAMGLIGAIPFLSFVGASLVASLVAERLGARGAAVLASGLALVGLFLVSRSVDAWTLAAGVFACGVSTAIMMPALSLGNKATVPVLFQGRVNAVMNAGTAFGVAVSVPAVLLMDDAWRVAYASFAAMAALGLGAAWRSVPAKAPQPGRRTTVPAVTREQRRSLIRLAGFAGGMGLVSAAYWVFAPDMVVFLGEMPVALTGWLWLAVGLVGMLGGIASELIDRFGASHTQSGALLGLSLAMAILMSAPGSLAVALVSAGGFGFSYMALTGVYLVSGIRLVPERPALGANVAFLAVAVGQAVGSSLAGAATEQFGYVPTFGGFGMMGVTVAALFPWYPLLRKPTR